MVFGKIEVFKLAVRFEYVTPNRVNLIRMNRRNSETGGIPSPPLDRGENVLAALIVADRGNRKDRIIFSIIEV